MITSEELVIRLVSVYVAQMALAVIFACGFLYFSKLYSRPFLSRWAISWGAFFFVCTGMAYTTLPTSARFDFVFLNFLGSATYMVGGFVQCAFLVIGTYELVKEIRLNKPTIAWITFITVAFALGLTALYAFDALRFKERYFIRIGIRSFITAIVFMVCGIVTLVNRHFGVASFGKRLLGVAFLLYGIELMVYFCTVLINVLGYDFTLTLSFFGVLDLFFITLMGLGMIMWLLEDERAKLKQMNSELDSFFYNTSHDLRAPISSILGLTHVAGLETKDETMIHYFRMIEAKIRKLDEVIGDILVFSKTTKLVVKPEEVDLNLLLNEIRSDLKFSEIASKIRPVYEASPANIVKTDASQLKIILDNLISNAIKYHDLHKEDPFIEVTFNKNGSEVSIAVKDNGRGIEREHLDRIFDMFYRASPDLEGSGLGLFIVKEAAGKINGAVTVESEFGRGSTFTLTFAES